MPAPRSHCFATELALVSFDGEVTEHRDHWRFHTPHNPSFRWGNLLVFREPPRDAATADAWLDTYERSFGATDVPHCLMAWDAPGERGAVEPFLARGFELDVGLTFTAEALCPPPNPCEGLLVRRLSSEEDWEAATQVQTRAFAENDPVPSSVPAFARAQMARYRRMVAAGLGNCWGGFLDGRCAGTMGLFEAAGLGRYQLVGTDPAFRRRGVAGTLAHAVGQEALGSGRVKTLVISADAHGAAARVYGSIGLQPTETIYAVIRYARPWR